MKKGSTARRKAGNIDVPLLGLNLLLAAVVAGTILVSETHYRRRSEAAALLDNRFLTTEWKLLQAMKSRTDRLLRDKDREIEELRLRYRALQQRQAPSDLLGALEAELRRAETERQAILDARFSAAEAPPSREAAEVSETPEAGPAAPDPEDNSVAELLKDRIRALELEVASGRQGVDALEKEIAFLRARLAESQAARAEPGEPFPASGQETGGVDGVLALLERQLVSLKGTEPTLSLADIRTRSLLRAIVRTPAIRAEYPDLVNSLDRYFEVFGAAERVRGKREAYEELLPAVRSYAGR